MVHPPENKTFFNQRESNGDDVWQSPVSFSSSLVSGVAFVPTCGTSVHISLLRRLETVLERIAVLFKHKIARHFLLELFDDRITICLIEQSSLGVSFRVIKRH